MARLPRIFVPGLPAHVRIRGNNRQAIFRTEGDRIYFHRCLVQASARYGLAIHAYVLMDNHVHLLATGAQPDSLARTVQSMGRRYVSYFNYLHDRTGTLWEGRYRSCPVQTERYFLVCHRYVELNPVRAGMVLRPDAYGWSSFRCNALGVADDLVTPHSLYNELGGAEAARRSAYRAQFASALSEEELRAIRDAAESGWALGDEAFGAELEAQGQRRAARAPRGRPRKDHTWKH